MSKEMDIEKAIKICNKIIQQNKEIVKQTRANNDINSMQLTANCDNESIAIETVLADRERLKQEYNNELDEGLKMSELLKEQAKEIERLKEGK